MIDSYHMVFTNISAVFLLSTVLLTYRFVFPRRNPSYFFVLILVSLLPLISLLRYGDYESGDFNIHIYRSMAFFDALKDGQFMPSWAGVLNGTFGYPLFIFNYNLPYYIVSFFHLMGFSFIVSMKIFLALTYIFSGIFMYLWTKKELKDNLAAFTASIFYLFNPYHLVDLHFRVSIGELSAFAVLPLLLLFLRTLITQERKLYIFLVSITFYFLMSAHAGTALFSFIILLPYTIFLYITKKANAKSLSYVFLSFTLGTILSFYIFFPYLFIVKYTYASLLTSSIVSLVPIRELLYSPWKAGFLFQGPKGELSFLIGYTQLIILIFSVLTAIKKNKKKQRIARLFWLGISFILLFLISPYSYLFWKFTPFVNVIQFSYRLLLLLGICIAVLAGYITLFFQKKTKFLYLLIYITILSTILNWGHRRIIPTITDITLRENLKMSTAKGEAFCCAGSPIWTDIKHPWIQNAPSEHINFPKGKAESRNIFRNSVRHEYLISAKTEVVVRENTLFFPGWTAINNEKILHINPSTSYPKGTIEFTLSPGLHYIRLLYEDIFMYRVAKWISGFGVLCILMLIGIKAIKSATKMFSRN